MTNTFRLIAKAIVVLMAAATLSCGRVDFPTPAPAPELDVGGAEIDLSNYVVTFEDEFDELDISGRRCDTRWIAHTPYNGDFGSAVFVDPHRGFPFITRDGILRIEARDMPDHGWLSGLLSSWNTCGEGFAQQYGYFEISAQFPPGEGFWPAFWLLGTDREVVVPEIDIFEYHTTRPEMLEITVHVWGKVVDESGRYYQDHHRVRVEPGSLSKGFNTYGVDVQEEEMIFYLNRREVWRTPTLPEFRVPLYILFNLGMEEYDITKNTPKFDYMYVDYVRVYSRQ